MTVSPFKIGLLATACFGLALPAMAQGTAPATVASAPTETELLRTQLEALQAQVDALKEKIAEIGAATSAPASAVASAPAAPAAASAPATALASTAKSTPSEPKTKIGGTVFFNVTNINQKFDGTKQSANGLQTDMKRFYLSVDHRFDDVFSANLTTDFNYVSNDSQTQLFVKKAYLQAKLSDAFTARVGAADMPWVPFVEKLYGYRYIENIMIDRTKYGTSTDWGVHAFGDLADGMFSYGVSAVNGAGYKKLTRSKSVDFEGRLGFKPVKNVTLGVGGYSGKLGKNIQGIGTQHRATRLNAVAAYTTDKIRVGGEYFTAKNWNNVTTVVEDKSEGWSGFASYQVMPQVGVFGRYDWVKPSKLINPDLRENYFNVGVNYAPIKGIDLALVYKRDKAENGTISTSNGTIGGTNSGTYDEIGVWGQVKF